MFAEDLDGMQEDMDGLAGLAVAVDDPNVDYIQMDPWAYRTSGGWTYNQCVPFQNVFLQGATRRACGAGYEPAGAQNVCGRNWVRQPDGSYIESFAATGMSQAQIQQCMAQRASDCSGCRPLGAVGALNYTPYAYYTYQVCEYQGGPKPPEETQKEYLITQAIRNGLISGQNCRNLSICDNMGRPASYLRSCTFRLQNGQAATFDAAAAYAAQFFNVPAQLVATVA